MESRIATAADVKALNELVNSVYRGENALKGWTTEAAILDGQRVDDQMLLEIIQHPKQRIFVLEKDGKILGCVQSADEGESVTLGMLSVPVQLQGQGLGAKLIKVVEDDAFARGFKFVKMYVLKMRDELIQYYERKGYQSTGETAPFPYGDPKYGLPKRDDLEFIILAKARLRQSHG